MLVHDDFILLPRLTGCGLVAPPKAHEEDRPFFGDSYRHTVRDRHGVLRASA